MNSIPDVEEGDRGERPVTPLVGAAHKCTDQKRDDIDDREEQRDRDVGESDSGDEQQLKEQSREDNEPLDVSYVLQKFIRL